MSFLKNILGALVEFKEPGTEGEAPLSGTGNAVTSGNPVVKAEPPTPAVPGNLPANTPTAPAATVSLSQYQKHFEELIEEANSKNPLFQGTDFKEFIDSKIDVEGIADESTRYRTTFNVLKRTGLTKEKLVSTGREYVNVIDRDVKAFETVYLDQYKNQVEKKEQQLQQKAQELQQLTEKIELLNREVMQITQEVQVSKDRLNSNKSSFVSAAETKKQEIELELKKIDQYFS